MKSRKPKKKGRSASNIEAAPVGGTELVCTPSLPVRLRASQPTLPFEGITSSELQELSLAFSNPRSICKFIYRNAVNACKRNIRAEARDEAEIYQRLAEELPPFLEFSDAKGIIGYLAAAEDPLRTYLHLLVDVKLNNFRTKQKAPTTKLLPKRKACKKAPGARKRSFKSDKGKLRKSSQTPK